MKIRLTKMFSLILSLLILSVLFNVNAYAAEGHWEKDGKGWWYALNGGGYSKNSWLLDGGKYYYFNNDGYMLANQLVGDYYLGIDGAMLVRGNTPDGYFVRDDGRWDQNIPKTNWPVLNGTYEVSLSKLNSEYKSGVDSISLEINTLAIFGYIHKHTANGLEDIGYQSICFYVPDNVKFYSREGQDGWLTPMSRKEMEDYINSGPSLGLELEIINNTIIAMYSTV